MIDFTNSEMNQFGYPEWISHFAKNDTQRLAIDFSQETGLTKAEKNLIFPSICAFQKGEGSDGAYLMRAVEAYVQKTGEPAYREAMRWFVREENWHSSYLKKFMDFYEVKGAKKSFLDRVFRKLRQLGGIKCEVTVLVTAEMIALTYYDALKESTGSPALKSICGQMLKDEVPHILFQSYTLRRFKSGPAVRLARVLLMEVTSFFVWCAFHTVLQAGGYSFHRFRRENRGCLRQSILLAGKKF